jgi:hypothetical protein
MEGTRKIGLTDEEIKILLETSTNEDGYLLLKKLERNSKNTSEFEKDIRDIFPNAPKGQLNCQKQVLKFFKEYENKKNTILLKLSRTKSIKPANTLEVHTNVWNVLMVFS